MQDELLLPGLSRRAAVVDIVVMLLFIFVMGRAVVAWGDAYQESHPMSKDVVSSWLLPVVVGSLFALALAATQTRLGKLTAAALGLRRGDLAVQVLWGVAGAALGLLADALWGAIQLALTVALHRAHLLGPEWSWYQGESVVTTLQGPSVGIVIAAMGVIVIAEEAMFRGIVLPRLRRITGRWWLAVLICSLLFGWFHQSGGLGLAGGTTLVSVVLCVVFIRSRSLVAAAVAHFLYNMTLYQLAKAIPGTA